MRRAWAAALLAASADGALVGGACRWAAAPTNPRAALTMDAPSPAEWREFRAKLISGGIKITTTEDGAGEEVAAQTVEERPDEERVRPVAPANEALLRDQNEGLWQEYINGAWAHPSPPEAGGLLCRLPLQAELIRMMRDDVGAWGSLLAERLTAEIPSAENDAEIDEETRKRWEGNTPFMYRLVERLIGECLSSVVDKAEKGRVDASKLTEAERELLLRRQSNEANWQSVVLLMKPSEGVVINRPLAKSCDRELARLILKGEGAAGPDNVDRFLEAFGGSAAVYLGGPDEQNAGGMCVHGVEGIEGASELAPGTRIYVGGAMGAAEAVLAGRCTPLDFRFFIGRQTNLDAAQGWAAVACARPLALKQCLGLPKPLWHEVSGDASRDRAARRVYSMCGPCASRQVMELCGGEWAELSRLELTKRTDLNGDGDDLGGAS